MIAPPLFDLEEPGTFVFTARRAHEGREITRLGQALRDPGARARFVEDERGFLAGFDLSEADRSALAARDWTTLLGKGGHLQAVVKIASVLGQSIWDVGAHSVGWTREELVAACPRVVSAVPQVGA